MSFLSVAPVTFFDDTDDASSANDKLHSCFLGVCDLTSIVNHGVGHVFEVFELCCQLIFCRMIHSVHLHRAPALRARRAGRGPLLWGGHSSIGLSVDVARI